MAEENPATQRQRFSAVTTQPSQDVETMLIYRWNNVKPALIQQRVSAGYIREK